MQINIIGQILDTSGYAIHTRSLANALCKIADVKLSSQIVQGAETLLSDRELDMLKKPAKNDINLIITSPVYWKIYANAKRNWVFLIFEGDKIPESFAKECYNEDIEYIFVASEHTYTALQETISQDLQCEWGEIMDKVKIIPHGVDLAKFYSKEKPKDVFRFSINKGFRHLEDRGGIQYFIQAYLEEFTNKDKVEGFIKINPAYGIPNLNGLIQSLVPKNKADMPTLRILADNIPHDKLVDFYNNSHVFVMPSRAEAFGIPALEAMACGLPVITTNFGGQTDFCNDKNGWIINGELVENTWELQYEGIKWLTPNIKELRKAMRVAYNLWLNDKDKYDKKCKEALETAKQFTWDNTAKKIQELI